MMQISNNLDLPTTSKPPPVEASAKLTSEPSYVDPRFNLSTPGSFPMEFAFELPKGYLDGEGNLHRKGIMRLAKAIDEIVPMRDPRVQSNPAYATVLILSRVITHFGALNEVSPLVIEGLFACDLDYLQKFYRRINELETPS